MEEEIKIILSDVFSIEISSIDKSTSQDTVANWDSIGHLNLITAIEESFDIYFEEEEIIQMLNFELVCLITNERVELNS
jgi:acyl carrier protein